MSPTWQGDPPPQPRALGFGDWWRVLRRGIPAILVTLGGLALHFVLRCIERPIHGTRRPWTGQVTCLVCRANLALMGIGISQSGRAAPAPAVLVANHSSWLDILALNAGQRLVFVSKEEVGRWPGIGWLARATGTVFIRRDRRDTVAQLAMLQGRLRDGARLLLFPEGTSSDGLRVLGFKPALFAAFAGDDLPGLVLQPVTMRWQAPEGEDARFYGWWGDMNLGPHLLQVLAQKRQGQVHLIFHSPLVPDGGRKDLAARAEEAVRSGLSRR